LLEPLSKSRGLGALLFEQEANFSGIELDKNIPLLDPAIQIHRTPLDTSGNETHHHMWLAPNLEPSPVGNLIKRHPSEKEPRDPRSEKKYPDDDTQQTEAEPIRFE
jgi:hypothetical protein